MNELLIQLLWNGLVSGALLSLVALGLTLIYGVAGFIQFAHGELVALGAYMMLLFHKLWGMTILPAAICSILSVVLCGLILEKLLFRPIRDKNPLVPLVISIGLSIGLQAILQMIFGPQIQTISVTYFDSISVAGLFLATPNQIFAVISSIALTILLVLFLSHTRRGRSLRAVSDNRHLAQIFGMSPDTAMSWIFGLSAGLAAVAGIFLGFEQNVEPLMGVNISVTAFAAVILGSLGSVRGAILGAFAITLTQNLLVGLDLVPSGFSAAIPFMVLIIMLLFKPAGIFGKPLTSIRE